MISRKLIRRLLMAGALVLGVFLAAAALLINFLNDETYLELIADKIEVNTGYRVDIQGEYSFKLLPQPKLVARDVTVTNPNAGEHARLLSSREVDFRIKLFPLFQGILAMHVIVEKPEIVLRVDENGNRNWTVPNQSSNPVEPEQEPDGFFEFRFDEFRIHNGDIRFQNPQRDTNLALRISNIDLDRNTNTLDATLFATGVLRSRSVSWSGSVEYDIAENASRLELSAGIGRFDAARIPGEAYSRAEEIRAAVADLPLQVSINGTIMDVRSSPRANLQYSASIGDPREIGDILGDPEMADMVPENTGPLQANGEASLESGVWSIDSLTSSIEKPGLSLQLNGSIRDVGKLAGMDLEFTGTTKNLSPLSDFLQIDDPVLLDLGPLSLNLRLRGNREDLGSEDVKFRLENPNLRLEANGSVSSLLNEPDFDLAFSSLIKDNELIASLAPELKDLLQPDIQAAISGSLKGTPDRILAKGLKISIQQGSLQITTRGNALKTENGYTFDLKTDGNTARLSEFESILPVDLTELGELGPTSFQLHTTSQDDQINIESFVASIDDARLKADADGYVRDLKGSREFKIGVRVNLSEPGLLAQWVPGDPALVRHPGSLDIAGIVAGTTNEFAVELDSAEFRQDGVSFSTSGKIGDLPDGFDTDLSINFRADSPLWLRTFTDAPLPIYGPLLLIGDIKTREDLVKLSDFRALLALSDVSGNLSYTKAGGNPSLVADLHSKLLDLNIPFDSSKEESGLNKTPEVAQPEQLNQGETNGAPPEPDDWLSDEPFNKGKFYFLTTDVSLKAEQLLYSSISSRDAEIRLVSEEGNLRLEKAHFGFGEGSIGIHASLDRSQTPMTAKLQLDVENVTIHDLFGLDESMMEGGKTSGALGIDAHGDSPRQMAANMTGNALFVSSQARLKGNALNYVSAGLISNIFRTLLPQIEDDDENRKDTVVQCSVAGLEIDGGVANFDRSIAFQTKQFNLGGWGVFDLNSGNIRLEFRSKARKGLGISLSNYLGGFKLEGHISSMHAGLRLKGLTQSLLTESAAAYAVAAFNPVGAATIVVTPVVRGIWDRATSSSFSCNKTIARTEKNKARAAKAKQVDAN